MPIDDKLKQIRLITGYITGMIIGEFWYNYEITSFMFTTSIRRCSFTFTFTKTIDNVQYKSISIYPFEAVFNGEITKERIVKEIFTKILKEIPDIDLIKNPVNDVHFIPGEQE